MDRRHVGAALVVFVIAAVPACGSSEDDPTTGAATTVAPTVAPNVGPTTTQPPSTTATTADTAPPTSGVSPTTPEPIPPTLPGEPVDPMFTPAGAELAAVGVPFDDPLVLRALPGDDQAAVMTLPRLATRIVSTGRAQTLGVRSAWLHVTVDDEVGWLPLINLLYLGPTEDATDRFVTLIGRVPIAPSMAELGQLVAESIAPTDFDVPARIVMVTEPFDGAIGDVTIDVLDLPDDSIGGQRLRITGRALLDGDLTTKGLAATAGYELVGVEATTLCLRGGSPGGLCV